MTDDRTFAFIYGCSRSGTTALAQLANLHPDVCIGYERFALIARDEKLSPGLYAPARFRDFREGDSHHRGYDGDALREPLLKKIETARVVGDKLPQLSGKLAQLRAFPNPKLIFILREPFGVAESFDRRARAKIDKWPEDRDYRASITEFNAAMRTMKDAVEGEAFDHIILNYRDVFESDTEHARLFAFLGVDPAKVADTTAIKEQARALNTERRMMNISESISMRSDFYNYRALTRAGRAQRAGLCEETS